MNWTTLVDVPTLRDALGSPGLVLVDCRFVLGNPGAGEAAWRESHLPGAAYAHLDRDLSGHGRPANEGRHPLPEAAELCAALGRWGISPDTQVVAYDAGDGAMAASRLWWLLRLLGHERVAVLDGGFAAWTAAGAAVESGEPLHASGHYAASFDRGAIAQAEEVRSRLAESPGWMLDARAPERFRGEIEPIDRVAGHVPGARNRPYAANLREGRFRSAAELRSEFQVLLQGRAPADVLLSCGSGVTACHNLLAMEHAGLAGARIYAASWSGWSSDPGNPVATGDA